MVDMYQTGIIITFILVIGGSMVGMLANIDEEDDTFNTGLTTSFNSTVTIIGTTADFNAMIAKVNQDFSEAASASDPLTQTILGGRALIQGALVMATLIVSAFTNWIAIVDILFAFTAGTAIFYLKYPIQITLSVIMIYTILKFIGDIIRHLPFFGG